MTFQIVKVDIEDSLTVDDGHGSLIIECIICELGWNFEQIVAQLDV